jgi:hypothetical protein
MILNTVDIKRSIYSEVISVREQNFCTDQLGYRDVVESATPNATSLCSDMDSYTSAELYSYITWRRTNLTLNVTAEITNLSEAPQRRF